MLVDTHIHVWNLEQAYYLWLDGTTSILNRTYYIEEIETERKAVNIFLIKYTLIKHFIGSI